MVKVKITEVDKMVPSPVVKDHFSRMSGESWVRLPMTLVTFSTVMVNMVLLNHSLSLFQSQWMKDGAVSKMVVSMEASMEVSMVNLKMEMAAILKEEATTVLRNHSLSGRTQSTYSTSTGQRWPSI